MRFGKTLNIICSTMKSSVFSHRSKVEFKVPFIHEVSNILVTLMCLIVWGREDSVFRKFHHPLKIINQPPFYDFRSEGEFPPEFLPKKCYFRPFYSIFPNPALLLPAPGVVLDQENQENQENRFL